MPRLQAESGLRQRRRGQKLLMIYVRYLVDNYVHNLKNPHEHWLCRTCLKFKPCRWPVSRRARTAGYRWPSTHRHLEPLPRLEPRLLTSSKPMNLRSLRSPIFNFSGGLSVRNHRLAVSGFDRHRTVNGPARTCWRWRTSVGCQTALPDARKQKRRHQCAFLFNVRGNAVLPAVPQAFY